MHACVLVDAHCDGRCTRIVTRDRGLLAFRRALATAGASAVAVGIHEDAGMHEDSGLSMAELGAIHEFGLGNVPERSFLRSWADDRGVALPVEFASRIEQSLINGEATRILNQIGLSAVGEIQQRMALGTPPPNEPATIARKGSSVPLIDTGALRQSIAYKVVPK